MIGYVTLGSNDIPRAATFYDELLGLLGARRIMDDESFIAWSAAPGTPGSPVISITKPFDGQAATVGNGVMVAIAVDSPEKVDEMYAKALQLGGTDEGEPGARCGSIYVAYFRDLDGNKLNAFCMQSS